MSDGRRFWRGWFEDWDDADAFLWALTLHQQTGAPIPPEIRRLPQRANYPHTFLEQAWRPALYEGEWFPDWAELPLIYEKLAVTSFLTSPTGSNQTWTSPSDWSNAANSIECIGGGGSGGNRGTGAGTGSGGGGAAYGKAANHSVSSPGTDTRTYQVASGGAAVSTTITAGNNGGHTWFNDTAFPTAVTDNSKASGQQGGGGPQGSGAQSGGLAGQATSSSGSTRNNGGEGGDGNATGGHGAGGGGAGGTTGAGGVGVSASGNTDTAGGAGGTANGGTAGTAGGGGNGGNGGTGTVWDASHGAGGGGGGSRGGTTAGNGGLYGGGGGGIQSNATETSGAGAQGIVVVIYTPLITVPRKMFQYRQRRQ